MGARLYLPAWGQFASVDPVKGGNANPYTYPEDSVGMSDLDGNFSIRKLYRTTINVTMKVGWGLPIWRQVSFRRVGARRLLMSLRVTRQAFFLLTSTITARLLRMVFLERTFGGRVPAMMNASATAGVRFRVPRNLRPT